MKLEIRAGTLQETEKCRNNFSCLADDKGCLCDVEDSYDGRVLFVKAANSKSCEYMMSFGYSHVCHCPTRKELYSRYRM